MSLTVMNFNRIRDLVSNLGCTNEDNTYTLSRDCLKTLESLEDELLKEDVVNRNIRISLHICGTVKEDLIPILIHGRDFQVLATTTRVLGSLSLPAECLLPLEEAVLTPKHLNVHKQLALSSLAVKQAFLNSTATLSIVTMLREAMLKTEKHLVPLKEEDCSHLKNCLILLRNLLHLPENIGNVDKNCIPKYADWQSVQNKLIWNLFVQGIDGALILMLNSKYREHWTVPLALIIALLFRNQNIGKLHQSLELVSSASESSGEEEESDASKNSSISLCSDLSKVAEMLSDSGCPLTSESSEFSVKYRKNRDKDSCTECSETSCCPINIHKKLQKVKISDNSEGEIQKKERSEGKKFNWDIANVFNSTSNTRLDIDNDSESSSSSESPYHKKIKGSNSPTDSILHGHSISLSKCDSAVSEGMDCSSPDIKSSDDDNFNEKRVVENLKAVQKLKSAQIQSKLSESDSSNEDFQLLKIKHRSHPPTGRRGKSPRRKDGCIPSICMDSAYSESGSKGRIRYPLWKKRNSVSTLTDINSYCPSDDEIGFLLKEFTLSFLHSGFSDLVVQIKNLLLKEPSVGIDKSLLCWMLSYFLNLAVTVNLSLNHINVILSADFVTFLVFECVNACENLEIHSDSNATIKKYVTVHLNLLVTALKEILSTIDLYFRKSCSQKDKTSFNDLYGKLSESLDFRQIPLLLFHSCSTHNSKHFLEDVAILNHHILIAIERGSNHCWKPKEVNMMAHLKQFSTQDVIDCCSKILGNFKCNSHFLNECVFTLLHHLAGDIHAAHLLIEPSVLKVFSEILKEDVELDQYQEDLIMYILNKFSRQVQKKCLKRKQSETGNSSMLSNDSSSDCSISSHCLLVEDDDDLFWWYLQFEQDKDPISRISEHIPTSKRDILNKLQLKGFVSTEKLKSLEEKMTAARESNLEIIANEDLTNISNLDDDITHLLRTLVQTGARHHLIWLQDALLETCYVKLGLNTHPAEPVPFYSVRMMLSVPLVPYTVEQRAILQDNTFIKLLQKLGLHLGSSECQMYPRIPLFWNVDVIFAIAARLGPMRKEKLKFSHEELLFSIPNHDSMTIRHIECPTLPPLSSCDTLSSWLTAVQRSKELYKAANGNETDF